jgi:L-ascorbate metabolism protein UlaG (beta-lactamase superfamily)
VRLTFHGHACVRLDDGATALVIDPGTFAQAASALAGATAVLVTHDHPDHVDTGPVVAALAGDGGLEVFASGPAAQVLVEAGAPAERVHAVEPGQELTVGDARIVVGGGRHALIHELVPRAVNVTYLVELGGRVVYHPGDSFVPPGRGVDVLLTPVSGPWMKLGEAMDYARATSSGYVVPVHDALLSDVGHGLTQRMMSNPALTGEHVYARLTPGESLTL